MSAVDPVKAAWQASAADPTLPSLDDVRKGADVFYRHIRRRNLVEYVACVLVVVAFGYGALFVVASPVVRAGALLVVLGVLVVAWQLHHRASAAPPPAAEAAEPILAHQRAQFARQRDALAQIGLWYLGPMAPGLLLILLAPAIERGPAALGFGNYFAIVVNLVMFGGIWWLNHRVARGLQKAIDEIDALTGETQ